MPTRAPAPLPTSELSDLPTYDPTYGPTYHPSAMALLPSSLPTSWPTITGYAKFWPTYEPTTSPSTSTHFPTGLAMTEEKPKAKNFIPWATAWSFISLTGGGLTIIAFCWCWRCWGSKNKNKNIVKAEAVPEAVPSAPTLAEVSERV